MKRTLLLASCLMLVSAQAQMYKCTDSSGNTSFQDRPCKSQKQKQKQLDRNGREVKEINTEESGANLINAESPFSGEWTNDEGYFQLKLFNNSKVTYKEGSEVIDGTWRKLSDNVSKVKFIDGGKTYNGTMEIRTISSKQYLITKIDGEEMEFIRKAYKSTERTKRVKAENIGLTASALQGKWRITKFEDMVIDAEMIAEMGEDVWIFDGNKYSVTSAGRKLGKPEPFTISGNKIKLRELSIKVLDFNGRSMVVDALGMKQTLEKK